MGQRRNTTNTRPMVGNYAFSAVLPRSIDTKGMREAVAAGGKYISWGRDNQYPALLRDLYLDVATLETIINGTVDYVLGNEIKCNISHFETEINKRGDTIADLIERLACDYMIYGGFAFAVVRNLKGEVAELEYQDMETIRSNEDNTIFYIAKSWRTNARVKSVKIPAFGADDENARSLVFYKGAKSRGVYPVPTWNVKAATIEQQITDYHLSNLNNGFSAARIFHFHNGEPDEETKAKIERDIEDKFCGSHNAGRCLINYTDGKEYDLDVQTLEDDNLDKKYEGTRKWSQQMLYTSFRAIPCLFGLMTENNGFSREEFLQAFELYNQTVVLPIQKIITNTFDKVFKTKNSIEIAPFELRVSKNISDGNGTATNKRESNKNASPDIE